MLDHGNAQLSAVGGFLPLVGNAGEGPFFGGGIGGGGMSGAFDISDDKIIHCALVFGRATVSCADTQLAILGENRTPAGLIYAKVAHDGGELQLSVHHTASDSLPEDSLEASYRLLYKAVSPGQGDKVWVDFRFVPTLFGMN